MKQGEKTRSRILDAADSLFYQRGYHSTAISDIVEETGLSKGNITYHFKSKKDILTGVVERRFEQFKQFLKQLENEIEQPIQRIVAFLDSMDIESDQIKEFGCPLGTLVSEFSKHSPDLFQISVPVFTYLKDWLKRQLSQMGLNQSESDIEANHIITLTQGIAMTTQIFKEDDMTRFELERLKNRVQQLAP